MKVFFFKELYQSFFKMLHITFPLLKLPKESIIDTLDSKLLTYYYILILSPHN